MQGVSRSCVVEALVKAPHQPASLGCLEQLKPHQLEALALKAADDLAYQAALHACTSGDGARVAPSK